MNLQDRVNAMLRQHKEVLLNSPRRELIAAVVQRREAMVAANGCLATWTDRKSVV